MADAPSRWRGLGTARTPANSRPCAILRVPAPLRDLPLELHSELHEFHADPVRQTTTEAQTCPDEFHETDFNPTD